MKNQREKRQQPEKSPEAPAKRRRWQALARRERIAILAALAVIAVLMAVGIFLLVRLFSQPPAGQTKAPVSYTAGEDADWETAVVYDKDGQAVLTAGELNYYYWSEYFYLVNSFEKGGTYYFDTSRPLDEQQYNENQTWQEYILNEALDTVRQTLALVNKAQEEDFTLTGDYLQSYEQELDNFDSYAVKNGFVKEDGSGDVDAYLRDSYGDGARQETFFRYLYNSFYASAYSDQLYENMEADPEQVSTYFDAYADEYEASFGITRENSPQLVNLRCIYFIVQDTESDADWQDAQARAQALLDAFAQQPSDEYFASLADENTEAPGAPEGGLYTQVYPGSMETAIDQWCFADGRQAGDCEIVKDENGYALLYLSSFSDTSYWQLLARNDLIYEDYCSLLTGIVTDNGFTVDKKAIALAQPNGLSQ